MKEQKLEENVLNCIHTTSRIECTRCDATGICGANDDEAVDVFIRDGWYATENNVYCPTCNEKRKKSLKKPDNKIKKKPTHR